jgi:hypothetical protein
MRNRISMKSLLGSFALLLSLPFGTAQALSVDSGTSTLTDGQICSSATVLGCLAPLFQLGSAATVSGGTLDITGSTLSFSFSVASAIFNGSDGPVSAVTLTDVIYSGSLTVSPNGPDRFEFQDQLSSMSGTATPTGAGAASAFSNVAVNTTGQCIGTPGTSLVCGFLFGPTGSPLTINGNGRFLRQSVNINAVPEPGTAVLLGLGLASLAASRRRASSSL